MWQPGAYPLNHPFASSNMDLAFELTTDALRTNAVIRIEALRAGTGSGWLVGSRGDAGAGSQFLQARTNLVAPPDWADIWTNPAPRSPPAMNWCPVAITNGAAFFRIIQRP
jgi:hypothetical protein